MLFYWGLWAIILFLSLTWKDKNYAQSYKFLYGIIVVLAILTGGREYVGSDWDSYKNYYETGIAEDKSSGHMEPIFELFRNICYGLGLSYGMFCFILCLLSLLVFVRSVKMMGIRNCFLAFLVYLSLFYCNYQFNIIRHGLLASFIMLSMAYLSNGCKLKSFACVLIGIGFHYMGLIFLPVLLFIDNPLSRKWFLIIFFASILVFIYNLSGRIIEAFPILMMFNNIEGYIDSGSNEAYGLSVGVVGFLLIALYSYLVCNGHYKGSKSFRIMTNMLLGGFLVFCFLNGFSTLVQRIGNLFNLSIVIVLPYIWHYAGKKKIIVTLLIIMYVALYYPKTWNAPGDNGKYTMLPFKTDITNLFR